MEPTYTKEGDSLKVVKTVESVVSREELEAEEAMIVSDIETLGTRVASILAEKNARLAEVREQIAQADSLGIALKVEAEETEE